MTEADKLHAARALIEDPGRWCKWAHARTKYEHKTGIYQPDAVKFCAEGALMVVTGDDALHYPAEFLDKAAMERGFFSFIELNDKTNHAAVLAMFDRAIQLAE